MSSTLSLKERQGFGPVLHSTEGDETMNELNHPSAIPVPVDVSPMATLPIDHHPVAAYLTSPSEVCRTTVLCALHKYLFSNWEVY